MHFLEIPKSLYTRTYRTEIIMKIIQLENITIRH